MGVGKGGGDARRGLGFDIEGIANHMRAHTHVQHHLGLGADDGGWWSLR